MVGTLPLTTPRCVNRIVTDVAVMDIEHGTIILRKFAPGWTPEVVQAITAARLTIPTDVREIALYPHLHDHCPPACSTATRAQP